MRTVSFSDNDVRKNLDSSFHCVYTNTQGDPTAGASFSHSPNDQPGPCGKGAGRQNVQCIFMTRAGEIFHVAGGFLSAEDLLKEIKFAKHVHEKMEGVTDPKQEVIDQHINYLTAEGFTDDQIRSGRVGMFGEGMPDFSPQDLGIEIPGQANQFFDQMHSRRVLADHRYCVQNPLISKSEFDQAPEKLVGTQKSFFGSNAAMNAAIPRFNQMQQSNQLRGGNRARNVMPQGFSGNVPQGFSGSVPFDFDAMRKVLRNR